MELAVAVILGKDRYLIKLFSDIPGRLVLHWGIAKKSRYEWLLPPEPLWPQGTIAIDDKAVQSHFVRVDGINQLQFEWKESENPFKGRRNKLTPRQEFKRKRMLKHIKKSK